MTRVLIVASALLACATGVFGQTAAVDAPARRVTLSAQAQVQVTQDLMTVSLSTTREGIEAQIVQSQLKGALEAALAEVKKDALPGQMDVRTGRFGLSPRYGRDGKISGWQGSAEIVLEGADFLRITAAAGKVQTLTVARVGFGLSPQQRERAQALAQAQAIASFRQRAGDIAKAFDAPGYSLDDVQLRYDDVFIQPRPEMMAVRAMADSAPVPAEAGLTTVQVSASGSVRLK